MKRVLLGMILTVMVTTLLGQASSVHGVVGYSVGKFVYRPANLDIVRYKIDADAGQPMKFPDYLKGMSFGLKIGFGDHFAGDFYLYRGHMDGTNTVTDSAGNSTTYDLRCRVSSFAFGGAGGFSFVKLGVACSFGAFSVATRVNNGSWESTFESKRKLWFGHNVYLSFTLPPYKAFMLEIRPYWNTSWFSVRMGHTQPLIAFRPSNFGIMLALCMGSAD